MAIDPTSTRDHGVRPLTESEMAGTRGKDGRGVNLPTATNTNPGPTETLRGIEPNTSIDAPSVLGEPMLDINVAGEAPPRGEPFDTGDNSDTFTAGPGDPAWDGVDSSAKNSRGMSPQSGSFGDFGEKYPGSGGLDG